MIEKKYNGIGNDILPKLSELDGYGKLSETGWVLDPKNLDDWRNHIEAFLHADGRYKSARQWCLGDAFNKLDRGKRRGECERLGLNLDTINTYCGVARAFKIKSRMSFLSFKHHQIVAWVDNEQDRDKMLSVVAKKKLTLNNLRQMLEDYRQSQVPEPEPAAESEPPQIDPFHEEEREESKYEPPLEPKPAWSEYELRAWDEICSGRSVIANRHTDINLIEKAKLQKKMIYAGRGMHNLGWGNPFMLGTDGNRDEVCDLYEKYFWMKKSLYNNIEKLKGKVIVCSCRPERCHGDFLAKLANGDN